MLISILLLYKCQIPEPEKIEQDLLNIFRKEDLKDINHLLVWHGRNTCIARNPKCDTCTVKKYCKNYKKLKKCVDKN